MLGKYVVAASHALSINEDSALFQYELRIREEHVALNVALGGGYSQGTSYDYRAGARPSQAGSSEERDRD